MDHEDDDVDRGPTVVLCTARAAREAAIAGNDICKQEEQMSYEPETVYDEGDEAGDEGDGVTCTCTGRTPSTCTCTEDGGAMGDAGDDEAGDGGDALHPVRHLYCSPKPDEHMTYLNWARQCPTA